VDFEQAVVYSFELKISTCWTSKLHGK